MKQPPNYKKNNVIYPFVYFKSLIFQYHYCYNQSFTSFNKISKKPLSLSLFIFQRQISPGPNIYAYDQKNFWNTFWRCKAFRGDNAHLYRGSWIKTWKEFPSAIRDLRNCNFDSLLKETGNNSYTSTMVSNASLFARITESVSSQHLLKTPSTPVTPMPSIMSLVSLNGTCQSWHIMS